MFSMRPRDVVGVLHLIRGAIKRRKRSTEIHSADNDYDRRQCFLGDDSRDADLLVGVGSRIASIRDISLQ